MGEAVRETVRFFLWWVVLPWSIFSTYLVVQCESKPVAPCAELSALAYKCGVAERWLADRTGAKGGVMVDSGDVGKAEEYIALTQAYACIEWKNDFNRRVEIQKGKK